MIALYFFFKGFAWCLRVLMWCTYALLLVTVTVSTTIVAALCAAFDIYKENHRNV